MPHLVENDNASNWLGAVTQLPHHSRIVVWKVYFFSLFFCLSGYFPSPLSPVLEIGWQLFSQQERVSSLIFVELRGEKRKHWLSSPDFSSRSLISGASMLAAPYPLFLSHPVAPLALVPPSPFPTSASASPDPQSPVVDMTSWPFLLAYQIVLFFSKF